MSSDETLFEQEEELVAVHNIKLVAEFNPLDPHEIIVTGNGRRKLGKGSGEHHFNFRLVDGTGKNVEFVSLAAADKCSTCPPDTTKPNTQIDQIEMDNGSRPHTAHFRDKNDNKPEMDLSYEWKFKCSDPAIRVLPFDPIIANGGKI
jgi:hypothetical protein